jgi:hypothetical protein
MTIESQALNCALVLCGIGVVTAATVVLASPTNARRVACWLVGHAMYVEHVRAEKQRGREIEADVRERELRRFEIPDPAGGSNVQQEARSTNG